MAVPLLEIGVLLIALLAIALAQQLTNLMRAVADLVSGIYLVGGYLAHAVNSMAQAISNVLGKAEAGVDSAIGASWHALARLMDGFWHEIEDSAKGYLLLAQLVERLVYAHSGLRSLVHRVEGVVHGIEHGVKTFERRFQGIEAKVGRLERDITKGIGHDLHIGLRDLQKEVKGVEHTVGTTIPNAIDYAEAQTTQLGRFIGAIPGTKYLDWVAGIVAAGLAAIGMDWLICRNRNGVNGKSGCDLWDEIGAVLFAAGAFGVAVNFGDIVKAAVAVAEDAQGAIEALVNIDGSVVSDAAAVVAAAANAVAT